MFRPLVCPQEHGQDLIPAQIHLCTLFAARALAQEEKETMAAVNHSGLPAFLSDFGPCPDSSGHTDCRELSAPLAEPRQLSLSPGLPAFAAYLPAIASRQLWSLPTARLRRTGRLGSFLCLLQIAARAHPFEPQLANGLKLLPAPEALRQLKKTPRGVKRP